MVIFTPSAKTRRTKFLTAREDKKSFPAVVSDVNEDSVDLFVYHAGGVTMSRVLHKSDKPEYEDRSTWDWPEKV